MFSFLAEFLVAVIFHNPSNKEEISSSYRQVGLEASELTGTCIAVFGLGLNGLPQPKNKYLIAVQYALEDDEEPEEAMEEDV
ncbi:hypothetical protein Tco_0699219 [Tanacetum coccineum]